MSSDARADRRRRARHADADYGVTYAWARDAEALPDAKRLSHDQLIRLMGARRRGPVTWMISSGDEALEVLGILAAGSRSELETGERELAKVRALLVDHGGLLVVATAPGRAPAGGGR